MSERFTAAERDTYVDNQPCAECGSRVAIRWGKDTRLSDEQPYYTPARKCLDRGCATNGGRLGSPAP